MCAVRRFRKGIQFHFSSKFKDKKQFMLPNEIPDDAKQVANAWCLNWKYLPDSVRAEL